MSKKIKTNVATVATSEITETNEKVATTYITGCELKDLFEKYPNVSIRRLCMTLKVTYGLVLQASKKPIPNELYNPEIVNYDEVARAFQRRSIDLRELDWNTLNEITRASKATLPKNIDEFTVGTKVYLRRNNLTPYEIIYKTESHIVLMLQGTTEPQAWSIDTFFYNGPSFTPRAESTNAPVQVAEDATTKVAE